ncbi:inversin-like [Schistocerca cancellata]|uniref:inversin-like n=1 Tax=Schistocerca cancellata TaxID=274614 RepID=UPI002119B110|nr:inversin-like [Schistocerca cancellata]
MELISVFNIIALIHESASRTGQAVTARPVSAIPIDSLSGATGGPPSAGGRTSTSAEPRPLILVDVARAGCEGAPDEHAGWSHTAPRNMLHASEDVAALRKKITSEAIENLHLSVVRGNIQNVKDCLKSGVYVDERLKGEWSPLMFACSLGHAEIVDCLLQYGSNPNFHKGHFTPLMATCTSTKDEKKLLECVKLLVYSGANVNAIDQFHHTPIMYASREGHAEIVDFLVQRNANVHSRDKQGRTALFWAINNGNTDVVKVLLKAGALKSISDKEFLPADLSAIATEKMVKFFHNDTNNNNNKMLSSKRNGLVTLNRELPAFLESNEALVKGRSTNLTDLILKDGLSKIEELKRRFYQQYETIYYLRLRLDSVPKQHQPVSKMPITKKLATQAREAMTAAECVYHNLRFLHHFTVQLSEKDDLEPENDPAEKTDNESSQKWSSLMVTIGIIAVTLFKTKVFGFLR